MYLPTTLIVYRSLPFDFTSIILWKSQTINTQYKEHFSDYRSWNQLDYAQDRLLLEDNIGEMLWMTCVSLTDRFARDKRNEEIKEAKSKVRNIYYFIAVR